MQCDPSDITGHNAFLSSFRNGTIRASPFYRCAGPENNSTESFLHHVACPDASLVLTVDVVGADLVELRAHHCGLRDAFSLGDHPLVREVRFVADEHSDGWLETDGASLEF